MASHADEDHRRIDREVVKALGAIPVLVPILETLGVREIVSRTLRSVNDVDNGTRADASKRLGGLGGGSRRPKRPSCAWS